MSGRLLAKSDIKIQATVGKVWQALTDPALIKQYLFGTDTVSDWKKGSSITWSGIYERHSYKDKGTIIDIVPGRLLHTTHYSPLAGKEDKPENYHHVIYELTPENDGTRVRITQDNVTDEKELAHMEKNWDTVLEGMKNLLEKR